MGIVHLTLLSWCEQLHVFINFCQHDILGFTSLVKDEINKSCSILQTNVIPWGEYVPVLGGERDAYLWSHPPQQQQKGHGPASAMWNITIPHRTVEPS